MTNPFTTAIRTQSKARIAIEAQAGGGKTMSALLIARGLVGPEGKIALVDSEHGTARKYAHPGGITAFDHMEGSSYEPEFWIGMIDAAEANGYDALIFDSFSAGWEGPNGIIELVDQAAARSRNSQDKFSGWKDITPRETKLHDRITGARLHIIATLRMKPATVVETDERGKSRPRKIGLQPIQRDNVDYIFDIVGVLDDLHTMTITKSRMSTLDGQLISKPGEDLGRQILSWLDEGVPQEPNPAAVVADISREIMPPTSAEPPNASTTGAGRAPKLLNNDCAECRQVIEPDVVYARRGTCDYLGAQLIAESERDAGKVLCLEHFKTFKALPPEEQQATKDAANLKLFDLATLPA